MTPNLQHPVLITWVPFIRGAAEEDSGYRELVQGPTYGSAISCQGQVLWGTSQGFNLTRIGTQDDSDGYVVFRTIDLRMIGATLHINDKITTFGQGPNQLQREVYIIRLEPFGHYPATMFGATFIKAFFKDRQPVRGT